MAKRNIKKKVSINLTLVVLVVCVAVSAIVALSWMIFREAYLTNSLISRENLSNVVVNNIGASNGLVSALLKEKSGCVGQKNVFYIDKEAGNFAVVKYGCNLDANMYYKYVNGAWTGISPTDKFIKGEALCSLLKANAIPKSFTSVCYDDSTATAIKTPTLIPNSVQ